MPNDERVRPHCAERRRGVLERLTLLHRRMLDGEGKGGSAEPVRGRRERHRRARRVLIEDVKHDPTGKRLRGFSPRSIILEQDLRTLEQQLDLRIRQRIDGKQVH